MKFPVDHLSASSLTTFMRCPRQWQDRYIFERPSASSEALLLGQFVHGMLEVMLRDGKVPDPALIFGFVMQEQGGLNNIVFSRSDPDKIFNLGLKMTYDYYEAIGKHLVVDETEVEVEIAVPGVPIPVVGRIDVLTDDRIIDIKTTGYFSSKSVRLNREWKFQANVYQLHADKGAEFHVVTRAKSDSIRVPAGINDPLYVHPPDRATTEAQIKQTYDMIKYAVDTWGDHTPWPGGVTHEWAGKYCGVPNCCQL